LGHIQGREALVGVPSQHREATMCAGVGGGERLAEGPDGWPRRRGVGPSLLCCGRFVLFRLWHEHDLRVDLVGVRLRLELDVEDAAEQLGGQIVEAHLVLGDLVHGRLHLLDVSLREVVDEVAVARDVDERAGAGAPELGVERIR